MVTVGFHQKSYNSIQFHEDVQIVIAFGKIPVVGSIDISDSIKFALKFNHTCHLLQTKKKIPKRRKKRSVPPSVALTAEQLEELWENDLAPTLSGLLQGHEAMPEQDLSPFDPSLDVPVDEQRFDLFFT